jgi:hypothetical protein
MAEQDTEQDPTLPDFPPWENTRESVQRYISNTNVTIPGLRMCARHATDTVFTYYENGECVITMLIQSHFRRDVIEWLIQFFPSELLESHSTRFGFHMHYPLYVAFSEKLDMEIFEIIIRFIIDRTDNLAILLDYGDETTNGFWTLCKNQTWTSQMLELMFELDPTLCPRQLDIISAISEFNVSRLAEIINVLYKHLEHYPELPVTNIELEDTRIDYYFEHGLNTFATWTDEQPILYVIKLSGELFKLIHPSNLTQNICNAFLSSDYARTYLDQSKLLEMIPEKFRKHGSRTKPGYRPCQINPTEFD